MTKTKLIRFQGFHTLTGKQIKRAKRFAGRDPLEQARKYWASLAERCYYPTFITGTPRRLSADSISARVSRNAGPEEI